MDRYRPPFLGRRRGWILLTFIGLMALLALLARSDPGAHLRMVALLALVVAFASASADINVDAYRTELLPGKLTGSGHLPAHHRLPAGHGVRRGAGADPGGPPALAHGLPDHGPGPGARGRGHLPGARARRPGAPPGPCGKRWCEPFAEFLRRKRALEVLAFILLYKLGDNLCVSLNVPFLLDHGLHQDRDRPGHQGRGHGLPDRGRPAGRPAHERA